MESGSENWGGRGVDDSDWLDSVGKCRVSVRVHSRSRSIRTDVKGSRQYSENMVTSTSRRYSIFVSSVAVTSMKTFLVSRVIFVASELICSAQRSVLRSDAGVRESKVERTIGGRLRTCLVLEYRMG